MSVNIKERLDFSCAIFDAEGALVANAPHVPVHLGAMGESVRTVLQQRGEHAEAGRRGGAEQPVQRRHASAGRDGHHAGVRRGGQRDPVLRRLARPSRRYRRHHARLDAARTRARWRRKASSSTISCWSMAGEFREAEFRALLARREVSRAQPGRERRRHQGAGRRQREGRAGTAARGRAVRLGHGARLYAPRDGQRRGERCAA